MIEDIKTIKSEKSDLRKFGITIGIILLMIAGLLLWKQTASFQLFLTIGMVFLVLGLVLPIVLKPVYWIWMVFAAILGWIMTRVILSLLFYTIFTPIGFIARLVGKQFLELNWDRSKHSYWNDRSGKQESSRYEQQF